MMIGLAVFIADIKDLEIMEWMNHFSLSRGEQMDIVRVLFKRMLIERLAGGSDR